MSLTVKVVRKDGRLYFEMPDVAAVSKEVGMLVARALMMSESSAEAIDTLVRMGEDHPSDVEEPALDGYKIAAQAIRDITVELR